MFISWRNEENGEKFFISMHLLDAIQTIANKHLPCEIGGVFTGVIVDQSWYILDFQIPDSYKSSRTEFTRNVEGLNLYLAKIHGLSNGKLEYIGEWHSHPFSSSEYSQKDYKAMLEIAADINIKIDQPLLLIIGVKKYKNDISLYQMRKDRIIKLLEQ